MRDNKAKEVSITQPLLKDLITRQKAEVKFNLDKAMSSSDAGSTPLEQPDLYQDPGSGYNVKFVFPQD